MDLDLDSLAVNDCSVPNLDIAIIITIILLVVVDDNDGTVRMDTIISLLSLSSITVLDIRCCCLEGVVKILKRLNNDLDGGCIIVVLKDENDSNSIDRNANGTVVCCIQ